VSGEIEDGNARGQDPHVSSSKFSKALVARVDVELMAMPEVEAAVARQRAELGYTA
jgi:hypothetical protein